MRGEGRNNKSRRSLRRSFEPMRPKLALLSIFFFACAAGGQSGSEAPDFCVDKEARLVSDLSAPAEGFSFSPGELLAVVAGDFSGDFLAGEDLLGPITLRVE